MNRGRFVWLRNAISWDGGLPFLVALSPEIIPLILPGRDLSVLVSMLVVPMAASLVRAHFGERQLRRIFPDRQAWGRQILFGLALIVLMGFEAYLAILQIEKCTIAWPWLAALGAYLIYLALVMFALRPPRSIAKADSLDHERPGDSFWSQPGVGNRR